MRDAETRRRIVRALGEVDTLENSTDPTSLAYGSMLRLVLNVVEDAEPQKTTKAPGERYRTALGKAPVEIREAVREYAEIVLSGPADAS